MYSMRGLNRKAIVMSSVDALMALQGNPVGRGHRGHFPSLEIEQMFIFSLKIDLVSKYV